MNPRALRFPTSAAPLEPLEPRRLLTNVLTWHNDPARTGLNSAEVNFTPANVAASSFGKLFSYPVSGQVYAQPLYVANVAIPGKGTHNVIIVATEANDVYALDATSNTGPSAGVLWHVNLGTPAAMPNSFFANRYGPYHDITPQVGITSTPVIDLASNTIYLDAFTNDVPGQNAYSHHIHALDLTTGADKLTPMLVAASVKGNGTGGNGATIPFVATQELQRPALTLVNGVLQVAYSGYADTDPYHGWLLGFDAATLQLVSVLNTTPNNLAGSNNPGEGGIWMTGAGPASDGTNLFLLVGNGDFDASIGDYGDSFLKISPDPNSTPAAPNLNGYKVIVSDYFTPYNQQALADADADLGSGGGILLPDQPGAHPHLYVGAGKQGMIYLVDRDDMGHYHAGSDAVVQKVILGHGVFSSPVYFNGAIYYHATGDVLKKYTLTNGLLSAAPAAQATISYGATPSVSSNGTTNGIIWDLQNSSSHQVLHAYDAATLAEIYNSNQNAARDQMGPGVKYITPTIADGRVFAGADGAINVYGLIVQPTTPPAAPTSPAATAPSAGSVRLTWVDNADNESGFRVERSTNGTTFTEVAVTSANQTLFTDTAVQPSTTYWYRVRATNVVGESAYTSIVSVTTPASTAPRYLYHLDAGSGTTAADSGASGNTGTLVGGPAPAWTAPAKVGGSALTFSGDGVPNQSAAESAVKDNTKLAAVLGSTSTLAVWVKTTQVGNDTHYRAPAITGAEQAGGGNDINWGTLNAAGRIGLFVGDYAGIYSTSRVNDGQWHHVAMTRDAVSGAVQLFVDGSIQAWATFQAGDKTSQFFLIGALSNDANDGVTRTGATYFNGALDEVRIYDQVLGVAEIARLAYAPPAPTLDAATAVAGDLVHLAWGTPSPLAQTFEVYRRAGGAGAFSLLATVPAGTTVYDDQTVTPGTAYAYYVTATSAAGTSPASNTRSVTPPLATVIANRVFYNGSTFDDQNGTSNITDRAAIATDKTPLLPGQTASFANYTSYDKGLNGIIIDVANMTNLPRFEDWSFTVGNNSNVASWAPAPVPAVINTYPGRGPGGSTQITVIWDDGAIRGEWLRVVLYANANTNLASDDVFYFGNAPGESGNSTTDAQVTSADELAAHNNPRGPGNPALIDNPYDYNRDGLVDAADEAIAHDNPTTAATALQLFTAPAAGSPTPAPALPPATSTTTTTTSTTTTSTTGTTAKAPPRPSRLPLIPPPRLPVLATAFATTRLHPDALFGTAARLFA